MLNTGGKLTRLVGFNGLLALAVRFRARKLLVTFVLSFIQARCAVRRLSLVYIVVSRRRFLLRTCNKYLSLKSQLNNHEIFKMQVQL